LLIVIYSALLTGLLGSGALLYRGLGHAGPRRVFTSLATGIAVLHALTLLGLPLVFVLAVLFAMAVTEGILLVKTGRFALSLPPGTVKWIGVVLASALPLWAFSMHKPLWAFDARNVWLFSGRIIFSEGRFSPEAFHRLICHWGSDYRLNMNADYPKLVGALAAAVATLAGYWNEYLPKMGILILHTLWLIGLVELGWHLRAVALTLLVTGLSQYRYFFDSASLDIHVAALTLIAILSLVKAHEEEQSPDVAPSYVGIAVAALAIESQLKYEGRALAVIVLAAAIVTRVVRLGALWRILPLFLLFVPTVIWLVEVKAFGVPSYLQHSGGIPVALARLRTDYFNRILPGIAGERATIVGIVALASALIAAKLLVPASSLAALARGPAVRLGVLAAVGYALVLSGVYLITPYPTVFEHMSSSIERATLPIEAVLLAAAVAVIERASRAFRAGATSAPLDT
jgi:hypothetical protein